MPILIIQQYEKRGGIDPQELEYLELLRRGDTFSPLDVHMNLLRNQFNYLPGKSAAAKLKENSSSPSLEDSINGGSVAHTSDSLDLSSSSSSLTKDVSKLPLGFSPFKLFTGQYLVVLVHGFQGLAVRLIKSLAFSLQIILFIIIIIILLHFSAGNSYDMKLFKNALKAEMVNEDVLVS